MISLQSLGQSSLENRVLEFDSLDLQILQRADSILSDKTKWNKQDERKCDDDMADKNTASFALFTKLQ